MKPRNNCLWIQSRIRGRAYLGTISLAGICAATAGDTWTGTTDQDWNTAANWGGALPAGQNAIINTASANFPVITADPTFTPVDIKIGNGASGRLDQRAGTVATGNGNWFFVGINNSAGGTYNLADTSTPGAGISGFAQGSGSLTSDRFHVGGGNNNDNGTGVANINTSGTITVNGAQNAGVILAQAWNGSANGTVNFEGGTINSPAQNWIGESGTGTWNQSGGTFNSGSYFVIGRENPVAGQSSAGNGTVNLSGGVINAAANNGHTSIGGGRGASGALNVSGGTFNSPIGGIILAEGYTGAAATTTGSLTVSGSGLVQVGTNSITIAVDSGAVGTVNLNGGTIEAGAVVKGAGSATFNFDGGTLKATKDNAAFLTGLTAAKVKNSGAVIHSNGFNITIPQALVNDGTGGVSKNGAGTLSLTGANTYTGATAINAGTLAFTNAQGLGSSAFSISDSATLSVKAAAAGSTLLTTGSLSSGSTGTDIGNLSVDFNNLNTTAPIISTGAFSVNGTLSISIANGSLLSSGLHPLIDYTSFSGTVPTGSYSLTPRSTGTLVDDPTNTVLNLSVAADAPKWTGLDNGNWVVGSTGPNGNWKLITAGTATDYLEGDAVLFDDSVTTGTTSVVIDTDVSPAVTTINNSIKSYSFIGAAGIAGTGSLTKNGTGTVTLGTFNTYTGGTTINDGTLEIVGFASLSDTGPVTINGGALKVNDTEFVGTVTMPSGSIIDGGFGGTLIASSFAVQSGTISANLDGSLTKTTAGTLDLGSDNAMNNLTVTSGTLNFNSGTTTANTGVVIGDAVAGSAAVNLNGGTLATNQISSQTGTLVFNFNGGTVKSTANNGNFWANNANLTVNVKAAGAIIENDHNITIGQILSHDSALGVTPDGGLAKTGIGNLSLAGNNTFTGPATITSGAVTVLNANALGTTGGATLVSAGSSVRFDANNLSVAENLNLGGATAGGALVSGDRPANNTTTLSGQISVAGGSNVASWWNDKTLAISGKLTGTGGLAFDRATAIGFGDPVGGRFVISNPNNDYTGDTTVNGRAAGVQFGYSGNALLQLGSLNALPTATTLTLNNANLILNGNSQTLAGLVAVSSGTVIDSNGVLTTNSGVGGDGTVMASQIVNGSATGVTLTVNNVADSTFAGVIGGMGANENNLGLSKGGTGTLSLTGLNTYTGSTSVTAGTLSVANPFFADGSDVSIDASATLNLNTSGATDTIASLYIGGAQQVQGIWGAVGSGAAHTSSAITGSGFLNVTAGPIGSGFAAWASANAPGQTPDQDHDSDGVKNGVEFFVGATGSGFTALPSVVNSGGTKTVTWPKSASYTGTYTVQVSSDLSLWNAAPNGSVVDDGTTVTFTFPVGPAIRFARLEVVPQ